MRCGGSQNTPGGPIEGQTKVNRVDLLAEVTHPLSLPTDRIDSMTRNTPIKMAVLEPDRFSAVRDAALDTAYVSLGSRRTASPHEFYRYPARFSPYFARAAIDAFTQPGDLVLDPFVGGGTTAVEARLAGRLAVGSDLNPLAVLVSLAKARPRSPKELQDVSRWVTRLPG